MMLPSPCMYNVTMRLLHLTSLYTLIPILLPKSIIKNGCLITGRNRSGLKLGIVVIYTGHLMRYSYEVNTKRYIHRSWELLFGWLYKLRSLPSIMHVSESHPIIIATTTHRVSHLYSSMQQTWSSGRPSTPERYWINSSNILIFSLFSAGKH